MENKKQIKTKNFVKLIFFPHLPEITQSLFQIHGILKLG